MLLSISGWLVTVVGTLPAFFKKKKKKKSLHNKGGKTLGKPGPRLLGILIAQDFPN